MNNDPGKTAVLEAEGPKEPAPFAGKQIPWLALKAAVSIALIAVILANIDFSIAWEKTERLSKGVVFAAAGILALQMLFAVLRWRMILDQQGLAIGFPAAMRISLIGAFFNQLLPSSIGGDVMRVWCVYRRGYRKTVSIVSVLTDRTYGMVGLLLLALMTFPVAVEILKLRAEIALMIGLVLAAALAALGGIFWFDKLPEGLRRWKVVQGLGIFSEATRALTRSGHVAVPVVGLSVLVHGLTTLAIVLMVGALEPHVSPVACATLIPVIALLSMVPVSIAGWGVREGVMVYGLGLAGVAPESALIVSIVFGLLLSAVGLVGGVMWLTDMRREPFHKT